jgi:hypothetical protein
MRTGFIETLVDRTDFLTNSVKQSIIGVDLNLPQIECKGMAEGTSFTQAFINRLVWDNGYAQLIGKPTQGDSLQDVYLIRPESALISCGTVQGISDHCGVLLDVDWLGSDPGEKISTRIPQNKCYRATKFSLG